MASNVSENDTSYSDPESFSDSETRELAEVLRRLERTLQNHSSIDWEESRRRHIAALEELSQADGKTGYLIEISETWETGKAYLTLS